LVREKNKRLLKPRLDHEIDRFKRSRDLQHGAAPYWNQEETGTFGQDGWSISSKYHSTIDDDD